MKLLSLADVHLTYPPKFRHHRAGRPDSDTGDPDDFDDLGGIVDSDETAPTRVGGRTGQSGNLPVPALRGVTLDVSEGEGVGVLGHGGSGRSTLMSVVMGTLRPDAGTVRIRGYATGLGAGGAGLVATATVRTNIVRNAVLMGSTFARANDLVPQIAEFGGFRDELDVPLRDLGRAFNRRLGYAVALHAEPAVFVVDEDLHAGPADLRQAAAARIAAYPGPGRATLVVTNRPEQLKELCSRAVLLSDGRVVFDGTPAEALRRLRRRPENGTGRAPGEAPPEPDDLDGS